jgi:hypothetical protein
MKGEGVKYLVDAELLNPVAVKSRVKTILSKQNYDYGILVVYLVKMLSDVSRARSAVGLLEQIGEPAIPALLGALAAEPSGEMGRDVMRPIAIMSLLWEKFGTEGEKAITRFLINNPESSAAWLAASMLVSSTQNQCIKDCMNGLGGSGRQAEYSCTQMIGSVFDMTYNYVNSCREYRARGGTCSTEERIESIQSLIYRNCNSTRRIPNAAWTIYFNNENSNYMRQ